MVTFGAAKPFQIHSRPPRVSVQAVAHGWRLGIIAPGEEARIKSSGRLLKEEHLQVRYPGSRPQSIAEPGTEVTARIHREAAGGKT